MKLYGILFVKGKFKKRVLSISMQNEAAIKLWFTQYLKQDPMCLEDWDGYEIVEVLS